MTMGIVPVPGRGASPAAQSQVAQVEAKRPKKEPVETAVGTALKLQVQELLGKPFTRASARKIARFAAQASKLLAHVERGDSMADKLATAKRRRGMYGMPIYGDPQPPGDDVDAIAEDDPEELSPDQGNYQALSSYGGGYMGPENVGNTFMRELVQAIPTIRDVIHGKKADVPQDTTLDLVAAIAEAKTAGIADNDEIMVGLRRKLSEKLKASDTSKPTCGRETPGLTGPCLRAEHPSDEPHWHGPGPEPTLLVGSPGPGTGGQALVAEEEARMATAQSEPEQTDLPF